MVYLFESKLLETKSIYFALKSVYGISNSKAFFICKKLGFSYNLKVKNLSEEQLNQIIKIVEALNFLIANELKKEKLLAIHKLISINSYRGVRIKKGFPVRGQRTHTNAKTAKRLKQTVQKS